MTATCIRCGAIGPIERHHPTGCDACGAYMHTNFTVRLCIPCHRGAHVVLRAIGIDGRRAATPGLVLARLNAFVGYMGQAGNASALSGETLVELAIIGEDPVRALRGFESDLDGGRATR